MAIIKSRRSPVELSSEKSITEYVLAKTDSLSSIAAKTAFIEGTTGARTTYSEFATRVRSLAGGLVARNVKPGAVWAILAPNSPDFAVVFHAFAYAGACISPVNPAYSVEEIAHQIEDAGAVGVITVTALLPKVTQCGVKLNDIVLIDGQNETGKDESSDSTISSLSSWIGEPLKKQVQVPLDSHVVALPYSSGTTGLPKGVMLTHNNLVANLCQMCDAVVNDAHSVAYAVLPYFHIYGMQVLMNLMLACGATIVTAPRFDLVQMLNLIQTHRITDLYVVPPIVLALAKHPIVDKHDLSSVELIYSGAAPLDGGIADTAATRIGCNVRQGYGMTELSPVTHSIYVGEYKSSSVGYLIPNTEMRIVDPDTRCDVDVGELWVRGPQVMKGYLNNSTATTEIIDCDGWLHTGDVARVDSDGHTYIVDRLKELIKVKGFQMAPAELEARLLSHNEITDAAVIGVECAKDATERPKGFVVRASGSSITSEEIIEYTAKNLATYKRLKEVEFIDKIPKSASGKILRRKLRDLRSITEK